MAQQRTTVSYVQHLAIGPLLSVYIEWALHISGDQFQDPSVETEICSYRALHGAQLGTTVTHLEATFGSLEIAPPSQPPQETLQT